MFSDETENVLAYLDHLTSQGLRKRNDLGTVLDLAAVADTPDAMNDLIFHGRHLWNLYGTLRKAAPGAEGYRTLETEFGNAVERVRMLLATLLVNATNETNKRFQSTYYAMTHGSLRNLVDFAHDLGVLKSVQNDAKREGGGRKRDEG
jgi:hypothetical protein